MLPWIGSIPTNAYLALLAIFLALPVLRQGRFSLPGWALLLATFFVGISGILGGRLFHLIVEKQASQLTLADIFLRLDGLTFYGALGAGLIAFLIVLRFLPAPQRPDFWDYSTQAMALAYGILRIGCFAEGCCWGKICGLPWAVRFYDSPVMPAIGIPVHPVQLYDSLHGFLIFGLLFWVKKRKLANSGQLWPWFLVLYSAGRFCTEFFRGDSIRGDNVAFALSTSQLISVALFAIGAVMLLKNRFALRGWVKAGALAAACLGLTACYVPAIPGPETFRSVTPQEGYTIYDTWNRRSDAPNLVFLAADDNIQTPFKPMLEQIYSPYILDEKMPRLEDVSWWHMLPRLQRRYGRIFHLRADQARYRHLKAALEAAQAEGKPFDVFLLTHGMMNHISAGQNYFLSYRELADFRLPNLNLVFMQGCYGSSLAKDWLNAGAKHVISFPGLNRNFFFLPVFLKWYVPSGTVGESYNAANTNMEFELGRNPLYQNIARELVKLDPSWSLQNQPPPEYFQR